METEKLKWPFNLMYEVNKEIEDEHERLPETNDTAPKDLLAVIAYIFTRIATNCTTKTRIQGASFVLSRYRDHKRVAEIAEEYGGAVMTLEEAKRYAEYTIQNLYDAMVPESINGHRIAKNLSVETGKMSASIKVKMNLEFQPNCCPTQNELEYSFSYAEMIPLDYLNSHDNKVYYETQWREYVSRLVIQTIRAIIDMDKRFPVDPKFETRKENHNEH